MLAANGFERVISQFRSGYLSQKETAGEDNKGTYSQFRSGYLGEKRPRVRLLYSGSQFRSGYLMLLLLLAATGIRVSQFRSGYLVAYRGRRGGPGDSQFRSGYLLYGVSR